MGNAAHVKMDDKCNNLWWPLKEPPVWNATPRSWYTHLVELQFMFWVAAKSDKLNQFEALWLQWPGSRVQLPAAWPAVKLLRKQSETNSFPVERWGCWKWRKLITAAGLCFSFNCAFKAFQVSFVTSWNAVIYTFPAKQKRHFMDWWTFCGVKD